MRCNIDRLMTNIAVTHNRFFHCLRSELDMHDNDVVIDCRYLFRFSRIANNIESRGILLYGHGKEGFKHMGYREIQAAVDFAMNNAVEYSIWRKTYF